ncbi:MAG: hypothetical protein PHW40_00975 [Candidatus Izemoplasmatales bacterium]|nr:hypothetical protein [Candidatus Izemoplasmatales bacterium]
MRNKLTDLNNHLFMALERLNDEELDEKELEKEIKRSRAVASVAQAVIANGTLILNAKRHADEYGYNVKDIPIQIEGEKGNGV